MRFLAKAGLEVNNCISLKALFMSGGECSDRGYMYIP
jgi:hypothetical protein